MSIELISTSLITVLLAVAGWIISHRLTIRLEVRNKRRELRVSYLIDAYRKLENAANVSEPSEKWTQLEEAIADIQLLGTPRQVQMAKQIAEEISFSGEVLLDELLFDLRETLRNELQLESVTERIKYLRFTRNSD